MIITIVNADAANTFYFDNFVTAAATNNDVFAYIDNNSGGSSNIFGMVC